MSRRCVQMMRRMLREKANSGMAHAGVIRALRENGIPIDFCGGTSMGGVVAAEYAVGYDAVILSGTVNRSRRREGGVGA